MAQAKSTSLMISALVVLLVVSIIAMKRMGRK